MFRDVADLCGRVFQRRVVGRARRGITEQQQRRRRLGCGRCGGEHRQRRRGLNLDVLDPVVTLPARNRQRLEIDPVQRTVGRDDDARVRRDRRGDRGDEHLIQAIACRVRCSERIGQRACERGLVLAHQRLDLPCRRQLNDLHAVGGQ
jgi:hypothetical protein